MIPKIIHYCWFGDKEKPELAKKCIASWKKYCPDFEIREWNDQNFVLESCPQYVKDARKANKFAFVTDYARLKVLHEYGGFYMDTDVEVIKHLDSFLSDQAVIGFENNSFVNSGQMLASEAGHPILLEMMERYNDVAFYRPDGSMFLLGCPHVNTETLIPHGLKLNGSEQIVDGVHVYPEDWFNPLDSATGELRKTNNTVSIHWYSMSWISPGKKCRVKLFRMVRRILKKLKLYK